MTTAIIFFLIPQNQNEMLYMRQQKYYAWGSGKLPFKKYIHLCVFHECLHGQPCSFPVSKTTAMNFSIPTESNEMLYVYIYVRQQKDYALYVRSSVKPHLQIPLHFLFLILTWAFLNKAPQNAMRIQRWDIQADHMQHITITATIRRTAPKEWTMPNQLQQKHWIFKGRTHRLIKHMHCHHCNHC